VEIAMRRPIHVLASVMALIAAAASGQGTVLTVDAVAGPYTTIQAAIDAAVDGDTVLLKAGIYQGFDVVGKSLTITGEAGQIADIHATFSIAYLAANQWVVLRGIKATVLFTPGFLTPPPRIVNNTGPVWIEDCNIVDSNLGTTFSGYQGHGVTVENCASVVFARCSLTGSPGLPNGEGIHAVSSTLSLHDCTVRGADSPVSIQPLVGGHAFTQTDGFVFASGTSFTAGKGSNGVAISSPGFPTICHNGGDGGNAIMLLGTAPAAHLLDCVLTPGIGGSAHTQYGCVYGSPGQPTVIQAGSLTTLAGAARHYSATGPVRGGQPATFTFQAPAGDVVWLAVAFQPGHLFFPTLAGTLLIGPPFLFGQLGVVPPSGSLAFPVTVPDPGPGPTGVTYFSQAVFASGSSVLIGPGSAVPVLSSTVP
jgi:hypothetical protein